MTRGAAAGLSVLAGVLGLAQLMVVGIVALVASVPSFDDGGFGNGVDTAESRQACADGDMIACDDLWFSSPAGSDDEAFAESCGGRNEQPAPAQCELTHGPTFDPANPGVVGEAAFGDDAELDALWLACEDGDLLACDDLWHQSPDGSTYVDFGATCGERRDDAQRGFCFEGVDQ